jgi:hypothetical protein
MSTTEIEPLVTPGVPSVRDPDGLPPGTDPHEWPRVRPSRPVDPEEPLPLPSRAAYASLLGDVLEDAGGRDCCRFRGPCSCPVPVGDDCPECGKALCPICLFLRDDGRAPYAGS